MADALIAIVAAFFLWMGALALWRPARVLEVFGTVVTARDTRNEIRAVYGGFGLAVAALLASTLQRPDLRPGVLTAIAVAVLGMAAGRIVSAAVDRGAGFYPRLFFVVEIALALALLSALGA